MSVAELEALVARAQELHNSAELRGASLRLASKSSTQLFADVWVAMTVGTVAHLFREEFIVKTWGMREMPPRLEESSFANSLPGLCALQLASAVMTDSAKSVIPNDVSQRVISIQRRGVLEEDGSSTRTLVEFDPQQPVARCLLDQNGTASVSVRRRLFRQLILRFRADLEIGGLKRGISPADAGPVRHLTSFLAELHENAYEHGRQYAEGRRQLRIVRLRKHVSVSKVDMLRRAGHKKSASGILERGNVRIRLAGRAGSKCFGFRIGNFGSFLDFGARTRVSSLRPARASDKVADGKTQREGN